MSHLVKLADRPEVYDLCDGSLKHEQDPITGYFSAEALLSAIVYAITDNGECHLIPVADDQEDADL